MSLESLLIQLGVASVVFTSVLWIVGTRLAGKDNVTFSDALWIGVLGVIISSVINLWFRGWATTLGTTIMILILLLLIKRLFKCNVREGFVISVSSWIIYWVLTLILLPPLLW